MISYVSTKGGVKPVDFERAILDGFASDGGLYIPEHLPKITIDQLQSWKNLSYVDLAFEILSLFIDRKILSETELKDILKTAYDTFETDEVIPIKKMKSEQNIYFMELFYGPTISFKDIGLAFLVNLVNHFLKRRNEFLTMIVATTGDTGPAAAHFIAGKSNLSAWVLYPKDMITPEQEKQMTTLPHNNIHPVAVSNCPDGGDDLDLVINEFFADEDFKNKVNLSSVNSINWGRIMMQMVHYFYGYLRTADTIGEKISVSVPSGGFGNLGAGSLAREMGLPLNNLIVANNKNACLDRIFSKGIYSKVDIIESASNAIDILLPINFWRYLYYRIGNDGKRINQWMKTLKKDGIVHFDQETYKQFNQNIMSYSTSDEETFEMIHKIFKDEDYLLDPHGSVAVCAAYHFKENFDDEKIICLLTAHPAKFPEVIKKALNQNDLPESAKHKSIELAKTKMEKVFLCDHATLKETLADAIINNWNLTRGSE